MKPVRLPAAQASQAESVTKSEKTYLVCPPMTETTNNTGLVSPFWIVVTARGETLSAARAAESRTVARPRVKLDCREAFRCDASFSD